MNTRTFLFATTALTIAAMAAAPTVPAAASVPGVPGLSEAHQRLKAGEEARFRRIGLAIRYASILDSAARALADHASTISDASLETHYATPQPLAAAHAPTILATQRELLTEIGARFVILDGWITAIAPVTGFPLGVTLADVQEAARGIAGMEIDLYSHTGRLGSGGGIQRPQLPAVHMTALATVGAGVGRSVPFTRWNQLTGTRTVEQSRWIPCPVGQMGAGRHQKRSFQREHFADGSVIDPAGGWGTVLDSCTPEVSYSFSDSRPCPGNTPGDIRWDVERRIMQDPADAWTIIIQDRNGPEENRCSFSGTGTTGSTSSRTVFYHEFVCPAGSTGGNGSHRFRLITARLAGEGHSIIGDFVEGRRIETDHNPGSCKWDACDTPADSESITIAGVPADAATVTWTIEAGDPCPPRPADPQQFTVIGENGREEVVWGWDLDGDGDLDTSNPLDLQDDQGHWTYRPPDGDCGGGCWDDGTNDNTCFLTTAVVTMRGEADDGQTLTVLRGFRDGWLAETAEGKALIEEYYRVAPRIAAAIPARHPEWRWIADRVDAARDAIIAGRNDLAFAVYTAMVRRLEQKWL